MVNEDTLAGVSVLLERYAKNMGVNFMDREDIEQDIRLLIFSNPNTDEKLLMLRYKRDMIRKIFRRHKLVKEVSIQDNRSVDPNYEMIESICDTEAEYQKGGN